MNPSPETPHLFDRQLYLARRKKANPVVAELVASTIAVDLMDRLALVSRSFQRCLLIADQADIVAPSLTASGKIGAVEVLAPAVGDDLGLADASCDAVVSFLDLQTVNDVPGHLIQLNRALVPDGLLMVCFFAGDTLFQLRESFLAAEVELTGGASPRVAPMIGVRELGSLLQRAGFALPVADVDRRLLRYDTALDVMREVKAAGFSNPLIGRSPKLVSRRFLAAAAAHYQAHFADADGRVRASLEVAWAHGWKPDPSQPKPLKPGSAKTRLADALKVPEGKLKRD